jgi:[citrate (pro-3S)-lyase] ligase
MFELKEAIQRPHEYGEIFINHNHFGPNGYKLIAEYFFKCIWEHKLKTYNDADNEAAEKLRKEIENLEQEYYERYSMKYYKDIFGNRKLNMFTEDLKDLSKDKPGDAGIVVVNCNPFTRGHRYLIEKAAEQVEHLYVLVVEEDKSYFKFKDRIEMVKAGTSHLKNISVLPSGMFVVSTITLPEYFNKENYQNEKLDFSKDLKIFGERIAPALKATRRFVGKEPYCKLTNTYNEQMKKILSVYGINVTEIERLEHNEIAISATHVRKLFKEREFLKLRELVPESTYHYLEQMCK